jgi:hypothetical protein
VLDYTNEEEQSVEDVLGTSIIRSVRIYDRADLEGQIRLEA